MVDEQVALETILAEARVRPLEMVALPEALGRFSAQQIFARQAHPPFACSVVDGYAVRSGDGLTDRRVAGEQPAGLDRGLIVRENEAIRIFTGAPIPADADAVVMQEDVQREGAAIRWTDQVSYGENIRPAGADLAAGQLILREGQALTPQMLGLLASQGLDHIGIRKAPQVSVISNGDELKSPGAPLRPGELYESNSWMLTALLRQTGLSARRSSVPDDEVAVRESIASALAESEVIVLSGGVSVGDRDLVRPALDALGIQPLFWKVRMKPGKPLLFATFQDRLIFGLPGNPVSAFVTFLTMVRPALRQMLGAQGADRFLPSRPAVLAKDVANPGDRPLYMRGKLAGDTFSPCGLQESHALFGLAGSNALLRLREPGASKLSGDSVQALTW